MTITVDSLCDVFENKSLFKTALTLARGSHTAAYERLEFLGDRVLGLVIANILYHRFPNEKEGVWAVRFTTLVCEKTLSQIARKIGLGTALITNEEALRDNDSILCDVCEAVLGALFLEKGLDYVTAVIEELWEEFFVNADHLQKDPKSELQEWAQQHVGAVPVYTVLEQTGPDHDPIFKVKVEVLYQPSVIGIGHSKKDAMRDSAERLLKLIQESKQKRENKLSTKK